MTRSKIIKEKNSLIQKMLILKSIERFYKSKLIFTKDVESQISKISSELIDKNRVFTSLLSVK